MILGPGSAVVVASYSKRASAGCASTMRRTKAFRASIRSRLNALEDQDEGAEGARIAPEERLVPGHEPLAQVPRDGPEEGRVGLSVEQVARQVFAVRLPQDARSPDPRGDLVRLRFARGEASGVPDRRRPAHGLVDPLSFPAEGGEGLVEPRQERVPGDPLQVVVRGERRRGARTESPEAGHAVARVVDRDPGDEVGHGLEREEVAAARRRSQRVDADAQHERRQASSDRGLAFHRHLLYGPSSFESGSGDPRGLSAVQVALGARRARRRFG